MQILNRRACIFLNPDAYTSKKWRRNIATDTEPRVFLRYVANTMSDFAYLPFARACYHGFMNALSYFEIQADDIQRASRFYRDLFGWKFVKSERLPIEYWQIETDGPRGGLLKRPAKAPAPEHGTNAFVCSMEVSDFDEVAEKIARLGGTVALPKFPVPGVCWQGYFIDPEGNTFGIFQPDSAAK